MENETGFSEATTSPSLIQNMHFRKPPSPKKISKTPVGNDIFWNQIGQNECAEGALIVKRPFPGSKVRNGGPDRCKSTLKFSRNKKTQRNFQEQKSAYPLQTPRGGGGVVQDLTDFRFGFKDLTD